MTKKLKPRPEPTKAQLLRSLRIKVGWTERTRSCYTCTHFATDKAQIDGAEITKRCTHVNEYHFATHENCSCNYWSPNV